MVSCSGYVGCEYGDGLHCMMQTMFKREGVIWYASAIHGGLW